MATVGNTYPSLVDVIKRLNPNGVIDQKIVEILNATNQVMEDAYWVEANNGTGHLTTVRTGIPAPTWRQLYGYVQPTKSTTAQITDTCGMLENYTAIDLDLAKMNGNEALWRLSEEKPVIEGISQEWSTTLFYGNTATNPEKFMGLAPRFNTLTAATAQSADNVISALGSGSDNTSVWLVGWGDATAHCIYPKGSMAGMFNEDLGQESETNSSGAIRQVYRTHYQIKPGFVLRDWRYVVRIANIDVSDLTKNAASGADLIDLMTQATELIPNLGGCRPVFYCNRKVRGFLRRQINNKSNMLLSLEQFAGTGSVPAFDGIPIKRCDSLLNTEAAVTT